MGRSVLTICLVLTVSLSCNQRQDNQETGKTSPEYSPLFPIVRQGKAGYIDKTGRVVIEPQFESAGAFSEGLAIVSRIHVFEKPVRVGGNRLVSKQLQHAVIDAKGNQVIQFSSMWIESFSDGLAHVASGWDVRKSGYIDTTGKMVIEPRFEAASRFSEGLASVQVRSKWGFIDRKGTIIIEPQFDWVWDFSEGLACVKIGEEYGYINKAGEFVVKPELDCAWSFSEGLALIKREGRLSYINTKLEAVIEQEFDGANSFSEGTAEIKHGDKWGYMDTEGKIIIQPRFDETSKFSEGLAAVKVEDRWGYIDRTGKVVIKPLFYSVQEFHNGLAWVVVGGGEVGYISKTGTFVWKSEQ